MGKVFACFSIALHNFKKWAVNPRLYILLLMEVLYLHSRLSPVGELCARTGYKVTPYLLPFLLDEGSAVMMLFLGVVLIVIAIVCNGIASGRVRKEPGSSAQNRKGILLAVLAGGIFREGEFLLSRIRPLVKEPDRLTVSTLNGYAGLIGASLLSERRVPESPVSRLLRPLPIHP